MELVYVSGMKKTILAALTGRHAPTVRLRLPLSPATEEGFESASNNA
jgi:hypothetical protein